MQRFKKSVIVLISLFFFTFHVSIQPAQAILPLIWAAAEGAAALAPVAAPMVSAATAATILNVTLLGGMTIAFLAGSSNHAGKTVSPTGDIKSSGTSSWVDTSNYPYPVETQPTSTLIPILALQAIVLASAASRLKYPDLTTALERSLTPLINKDTPVNAVIIVPGGASNFIVTSKWATNGGLHTCGLEWQDGNSTSGGLVKIGYGDASAQFWAGACYYGNYFAITPGGTSPPHSLTPTQTIEALHHPYADMTIDYPAPATDEDVFTDKYGADIDSFIKGNPNVTHTTASDGSDIMTKIPQVSQTQLAVEFNPDGSINTNNPAYITATAAAAAAAAAAAGNNANIVSGAAATAAAAAAAVAAANTAAKTAADASAAAAAAAAAANQGTTSSPSMSPYGGTVGDFGARMTKFINDCKTSPLFSMLGSVVGNIPGGGVSTYLFDCGHWGQVTFDFANWASALAVMKSIMLIAFGWVAIRIVTKGGA